jgi:hypothetical protein
MAAMTAFAAALAAAQTLRNRTWAGARVLLEPGASVDVTAPTICVYGVHGSSHILRRALSEAKHCRLRLELLLPASVQATDGANVWTLDMGSSAALAFALFWRQCEIALQADRGTWANLFRALIMNVSTIETSADPLQTPTTSKVAARALQLIGETIDGPRIGVEPEGAWADLLAAMRGDVELASRADLVSSTLVGGVSFNDWRSDFALLGLSQSYGPPLGLAPDGDIDNQPASAEIEAAADAALNDPQI